MNSEKVKKIKKALGICKGLCNEDCPYHSLGCMNDLSEDALTLIYVLESENERLTEERDLYKNQFNELEPRFFDLREENKQLKDRIAELENGNEALRFVVKQGFNDCQAKIIKQFAERLKEKICKIFDDKVLFLEDLDETLKEFLGEEK